MRKFVFKLILTMLMLSIAVQVTMWLIPTHGRIGGLIELLIAASIGVLVILFATIHLQLLSYRELKHLPFGNKLYHMKRGKH